MSPLAAAPAAPGAAPAGTGAGHPVRWLSPAPLWSGQLAQPAPTPAQIAAMHRPAILRMTSDDFMEELAALLDEAPAELAGLEAQPRSYRALPPGAAPGRQAAIDHVKLFQPVHGHFNLVAATLACGVPGLPDKAVATGAGETTSFVLRRAGAGGAELAWTPGGWTPVARPGALAPGEALVPLFGMPYAVGDRRRRLLVGFIATASLSSAPSGGPASLSPQPGDRPGEPPDRRLEEIATRVVEPLRAIYRDASPPGLTAAQRAAHDAAQAGPRGEASRFLLLDLGELLAREAPALWAAVQARVRPGANGPTLAYDLLRDTFADAARSASWLDALRAVWAEREALWGETAAPATYAVDLSRGSMDPEALRQRIEWSLPARTPEQREEPQPPFAAPKLDPRPGTRYVVRCVYRRPGCGPLHPDLLSDPSRPFAIAGFFDLDAPARPLHIQLPIDTSIAGLRKAPKNVSFAISRELRGQMERVTDLKKAMDGQVAAAGSFDLGMICSFSIPIITICALIVLLIFVYLLNFVFWWVPFLRICFPIPLKAKG